MIRKLLVVLLLITVAVTPVYAHGKKGGGENDLGNQSLVWMIARKTSPDVALVEHGRFFTPSECEAKLKTLDSRELYVCNRFPD